MKPHPHKKVYSQQTKPTVDVVALSHTAAGHAWPACGHVQYVSLATFDRAVCERPAKTKSGQYVRLVSFGHVVCQ